MRRILLPTLLALSLALPTGASAQFLGLYDDPGGNDCRITDRAPGEEVVIYVVLSYPSGGATGVSFSAPMPSECGLTYVYDEVQGPSIGMGDSQTGIVVGFTQCVTEPTLSVLAMHFVRTSVGEPCCVIYTARNPDDDAGPLLFDCAGVDYPPLAVRGAVINTTGSCSTTFLHSNPSPADGATEVPLTVDLSWTGTRCLCGCPLPAAPSGDAGYLYFGTSSDPPAVDWVDNPHAVGPLDPETVYYWKIGDTPPGLGGYIGPVWHFTTAGANPVATSTWGAIKALYR